jgi:hypothetical protein
MRQWFVLGMSSLMFSHQACSSPTPSSSPMPPFPVALPPEPPPSSHDVLLDPPPEEGWACFDNKAFSDMSLCFRFASQCTWAKEYYRAKFARAKVGYDPTECYPAPSPLYCFDYRLNEEYRAFLCCRTETSADFFWKNMTAFEHLSGVYRFDLKRGNR